MTRHVFLEGPSGIGKTTALIEYIKTSGKTTKGFITQRVEKNSETIGFRITPAENAQSPTISNEQGLRGVFLEKTILGWKRNNRILIDIALPLIGHAEGTEVFVLDEIGGIELEIPSFYQKLIALLKDRTPCIGVIKSPNNCRKMTDSLLDYSDLPLLYCRFRDYLKTNPDVSIISCNKTDDLFNVFSGLIL